MFRTVEIIAATTLAAALALSGCSESSIPTDPLDEPAFFSHAPAPGFSVIRRDAPLSRELTVTRTIGPEGGTLDIEAAGIRVSIPAGALDGPRQITLSARAGTAVAFELAPGGLELGVAATVEVTARGTNAASLVEQADVGSPIDGVIGVTFDGEREGAAEPVRAHRAYRSVDGIVVEIMGLLAGYATASG